MAEGRPPDDLIVVVEPVHADRTALAAEAAQAARNRRRRRSLGAAALAMLVAVVGGVALTQAQRSPAPEPLPGPTAVPPDVVVLPPFDSLTRFPPVGGVLPANFDLTPTSVDAMPSLTSAPLSRAVIVAEGDMHRLVLVAADGTVRRLDDPRVAAATLLTTSLSPGGTVLALPAAEGGLVLVDVTTGVVDELPAGAATTQAPALVWLRPDLLLLPGPDGSRVVNTTTRVVTTAPVPTADVVTIQGDPTAPLTVLFVGERNEPDTDSPYAIRSFLTVWHEGNPVPDLGPDDTGPNEVHDIAGPRWLEQWVGPGFGSGEIVVRACVPETLALPTGLGAASAAVAAIAGDRHAGTLATIDGTQLEPLGFAARDMALVAAHGIGGTVVLVWTPANGKLERAATTNADATVSVTDLLLYQLS
jgi:hypothetical protein